MLKVFYIAVVVIVTFALNHPLLVPFSLFKVLNPQSSIWSLAQSLKSDSSCMKPQVCSLAIEKYRATYNYDKNNVLHISAESDQDLYFAQGYLSARDRLFSMDLRTRVASGRLSQLVGKKGVGVDQFFIRIGMTKAVADSTKLIEKDPETSVASASYISGVNTWIEQAKKENLVPLEYHLLGSQPERWDLSRIASLVKLMDYRLSGVTYDLKMTRLLKKYSWQQLEVFFSEHGEGDHPYIDILSSHLKVKSHLTDYPLEEFLPSFEVWPEKLPVNPNNGSNNWAIGPDKSAVGATLVANDPHLSYSNPMLFYETQLSSPKQNVYGMSLPGAPGVILGFNEKTAWATTNGYTDVWDWYEVVLNKEGTHYYFKGELRPLIKEVVTYKVKKEWEWNLQSFVDHYVKGEKISLKAESVYYTHLGPVISFKNGRGLVSSWVSVGASNELSSFLKVNKAQTIEACEMAFKDYKTPSQNMICADSSSVSITQVGELPLRGRKQGVSVMEGEGAEGVQFIEYDKKPYQKNPKRGFVYSANQRPTGEDYYPLGWRYANSYRGKRIEQLLQGQEKLSVQDIMQIQNDKKDLLLEELFEVVLLPLSTHWKVNDDEFYRFLLSLFGFSFDLNKSDKKTLFAQLVWKDMVQEVCSLFNPKKEEAKDWLCVRDQRLLSFFKAWSQNRTSDLQLFWVKETMRDPMSVGGTTSFVQFIKPIYKEAFAVIQSPQYKEKIKQQLPIFNVPHILKTPSLGFSDSTIIGGSTRAIHANYGPHGPVFQMVVQLTQPVEAWVNRPGIRSGLPHHPRFKKQMKQWVEGKHYKVDFYRVGKE